jgi:hypothetical protein
MSSRRVIRPTDTAPTRPIRTLTGGLANWVLSLDLEPPARQIIALAGAVADDMLPAPTPCGDYTVKDLLAHFMGLTIAFRDAAASAEPGQRGPFGTAVEVAPDAPVLDRAVGLSGRDPNWPSERS